MEEGGSISINPIQDKEILNEEEKRVYFNGNIFRVISERVASTVMQKPGFNVSLELGSPNGSIIKYPDVSHATHLDGTSKVSFGKESSVFSSANLPPRKFMIRRPFLIFEENTNHWHSMNLIC